MPKISYGAWVTVDGFAKIRIHEADMRQILREEFPDEVVDRIIHRLHSKVEHDLRRL